MGLNDPGLLIVLIIAFVAATGGTAALWHHGPQQWWASWPGRLGLILLCQLTAVGVVGVIVNNSGHYYTSWGELFGQEAKADPNNNSAQGKVDPNKASQELAAQLANHKSGSIVVTLTMPNADGGTQPVAVYVPAAYFEPANAERRFPVIEMLPGFPGTPLNYTDQLKVQATADAEITAGRATPFLGVMPSQNYRNDGHDSECLNAPNGLQAETTVTTNVHTLMTQFRASQDRRGWAIMGFSTGGYCALNIAMRHPDLYAAAASIAGYTTPYEDDTTGPIFKNNPASFKNDNDPLWQIKNKPAPDVSVLLVSSKPDVDSYQQATEFLPLTKAPMRAESLLLNQGGHNFAAWLVTEPLCFDWLSARLATPLAPALVIDGQSPAPASK